MSFTIEKVKKKYSQKIMAIPDVVGVGISLVGEEQVLNVLVSQRSEHIEKKVPKAIKGFRVIISETGTLKAM